MIIKRYKNGRLVTEQEASKLPPFRKSTKKKDTSIFTISKSNKDKVKKGNKGCNCGKRQKR